MKSNGLILTVKIVTAGIALVVGVFVGLSFSTEKDTVNSAAQAERATTRVVQQTLSTLSSSNILMNECDSVTDTDTREKCYIYNAVRSKSSTPCQSIEGDQSKRRACYVSTASVLSDENLCANVPDTGWREYCLSGLGNSNRILINTLAALDTDASGLSERLKVDPVSNDRVALSWGRSESSEGVARYRIYRDGEEIAEVDGTSYEDINLTSGRKHSYQVRAYDESGSESSLSETILIKVPSQASDNVASNSNRGGSGSNVGIGNPGRTSSGSSGLTVNNGGSDDPFNLDKSSGSSSGGSSSSGSSGSQLSDTGSSGGSSSGGSGGGSSSSGGSSSGGSSNGSSGGSDSNGSDSGSSNSGSSDGSDGKGSDNGSSDNGSSDNGSSDNGSSNSGSSGGGSSDSGSDDDNGSDNGSSDGDEETPPDPDPQPTPPSGSDDYDIPTSGLVAYYDFNEDSGDVIDKINGNNGVLKGDASRTNAGFGAGALLLDGDGDYMNVADVPTPDSVSISVWARLDNRESGSHQYVIGVNPSWPAWNIQHSQWHGWYAGYYTDAGADSIRWFDGFPSLEKWYHLTLVIADGTSEFYVNGELAASKDVSGSLDYASGISMSVGANTGGSKEYFEGVIDELAIYDRKLTAEEVEDIYDSAPSQIPVAVEKSYVTTEDVPVDMVLQGYDLEGLDVSFEIVDEPSKGTLSNLDNAPYITYTPNSSFSSGTDTFSFRVNNGFADSNEESVSIKIPQQATPGTCGNNIIDPGEVCDGSAVSGLSCQTVAAGYKSGSLGCQSNCLGYDVSSCTPGNRHESSCELDELQATVNAANDGDMIEIQPGICYWESSHSDSYKSGLSVNKNLIIAAKEPHRTVIYDQSEIDPDDSKERVSRAQSGAWITFNTGSDKPFRLTGFVFKRLSNYGRDQMVRVVGDGDNWRVDNNYFLSMNREYSVHTSGSTYGLIDRNFIRGGNRLLIYGAPTSDKPDSFKKPFDLGSSQYVTIEDNYLSAEVFHKDGVPTIEENASGGISHVFGDTVDASNGGKYTFRYNSVYGKLAEVHGPQGKRGTHSYALYENTFHDIKSSSASLWTGMALRGGTGVLFNNEMNDSDIEGVNLYVDRACLFSGGFAGRCDGTTDVDGNALVDYDSDGDGIADAKSGYPCMDQHGRVTDAGSGGSSNVPVHPQEFVPLYQWGNTHDNLASREFVFSDTTPNGCAVGSDERAKAELLLIENRDYYNENQGFNGTSGVGVGRKASRPAGCTKNTAYWASDEDTLYRCIEENTWETYYTPYPYPHPLAKIDNIQAESRTLIADSSSSENRGILANLTDAGSFISRAWSWVQSLFSFSFFSHSGIRMMTATLLQIF